MKWEDRIGRRIKLRDLHIVLAVAQAGSMARAAAELSASHPVISRTISDLEAVLGVSLFDRGARGVTPTIYGKAMVECALATFDQIRLGLRQIEFLANPTAGELSLACPEGIAAGFVRAVSEHFMQDYPDVMLEIVQAETAISRIDELRDREIELLIGRLPTALLADDLVAEPLFPEQMLVVAGTQSPWLRRRNVDLADLADEDWVLPSTDSVPGQICAELFQACAVPFPRVKMVTLSVHLQHALVEDGKCLTMLPRSLLHFAGKRLGLREVRVKFPLQESWVGLITLRGRTLSPLTQRFVDCARTIAAPLATAE